MSNLIRVKGTPFSISDDMDGDGFVLVVWNGIETYMDKSICDYMSERLAECRGISKHALMFFGGYKINISNPEVGILIRHVYDVINRRVKVYE